ncbi:MAG TPA: universal stress protein [Polyangiaceae bacterium]|nr:universal stress protein [Polyangiaceae bacterium]
MTETSTPSRKSTDAPFVVIAALDHSERDQAVLAAALGLARGAPGAALHLAHIVDPGPPGPLPIGTTPRIPATLSVVENAERFLGARATEAAGELGRPVHAHLLEGAAWRELVQLGVDLGAHMLVVGTHDYHGLRRFVLGSVAQEVVRAAPFPVLVARAAPAKLGDDFRAACGRCRSLQDTTAGAKLFCAEHEPEHPKSRVYGPPPGAGR